MQVINRLTKKRIEMIKKHYTKTFAFLTFLCALFQINATAQHLVVSGQKIINTSNNQEIVLNAINFGNWMVMEGYMMNSNNQAPAQHDWKQKLTTLLGPVQTKQFYDAWLTNHVTQVDINQVKAWGFNAVRLPLHYEYFVNLETPDVWNNQGFDILDSVISWCSAAGVYAIVDLHAAPGGQSDNAISDYDDTKPSLWESASNQSKTVRLWRKLSERYKNEPWIAGYDLINEPAWNLPNGTLLRNLYNRLTDTIRSTGDDHILFIEGNWYSNDYTGLTPAWDDNMVYVFHKYWSNTNDVDIQWVLDLRNQQNRPIWCGEHGENSNNNFTRITELFNRNNIGMSWWPMKKFESTNDFADADWPAGYNSILSYLGGTNPNLSPTTALNILMQLAENVKLENATPQTEVLRSIFTQPGNRDTEPFAVNTIPGRIYATNYDMGMNGYAYSDQAWEDLHLTTSIYTAWNEGWTYRNNGVDIEACTDASSNGYNVGWFNKDEWMKYTCDVSLAGTYTIEFRVANGGSTSGTIQIQNADGTELLATAIVPATGSWTSWTTVSCTGGFAATGIQSFRIVNTSGGYNVASINFVFLNSTIPLVTPLPVVAKVISLRGNNNKYVTYSGVSDLMTSTRASVGATEQYTLIDAGNGLTAMKGYNGKYVTLKLADNKLYCNGDSVGINQKFTLENLNGLYTIKGSNNKYVSSENGSIAGLTCTRTAPAGWEFFNWNTIANPLSLPEIPVPTTFSIFPNPASNLLYVKSAENKKTYIIIYDISGKIILTSALTGPRKSVDIRGLSNGIYLLKLIEENKTETVKFIKND